MKRRLLSILMTFVMVLSLFQGTGIRIDAEGEKPESNFLTFTAEEYGAEMSFKWGDSANNKTVMYRASSTSVLVDGESAKTEWTAYTPGAVIKLGSAKAYVQFKGTNVTTDGANHFRINGNKIAASGSVTSLTDGCGVDADVTLTDACYQYMFAYCTALTKAPELPAKTLAKNCYSHMFMHCTSLTAPADLSHVKTIAADDKTAGCCQYMYGDCTGFGIYSENASGRTEWKAPSVTSVTGAENWAADMFKGCAANATVSAGTTYYIEPVTADALTPNYLTFTAEEAGAEMKFDWVNSDTNKTVMYRVNSEEVKIGENVGSTAWHAYTAGTIITFKYAGDYVQFKGTGVTTDQKNHFTITGKKIAASGSVTSLTDGCGADPNVTLIRKSYYYMFSDCTSLTKAPALPAITASVQCYSSMFSGCTSLISAPELPATTLNTSCYNSMFLGCTSLTKAPALPATELAVSCYCKMFGGCTSLTSVPVLNATTLAKQCYYNMFSGCTKLLVSAGTSSDYTWKIPYPTTSETVSLMTSDTAPGSVPVETAQAEGTYNYYKVSYVEPDYLTFTAEEDRAVMSFKWASGSDVMYRASSENILMGEVAASTNWTEYTAGTDITLTNKGDSVQFKGTNVTTGRGKTFTIKNKKIAASGSVTSLTDGWGTNPNVKLTDACCQNMFAGCTSLTAAPSLPATTLEISCYHSMFSGCKSLTVAPSLPATALADQCYYCMFAGCTSLTTAPALPATTLADQCYSMMFVGCSSLTAAPLLPATTLANQCYDSMFSDCSSLTVAPSLPATTLAVRCYVSMFDSCTSLTAPADLSHVETLAADNSIVDSIIGCCQYMYKGCTGFGIYTENADGRTEWKATSAESDETSANWAANIFKDCAASTTVTAGTTYYIGTVLPKSISGATVTVNGTYTYTGKEIVPADKDIIVKDGGVTLVKDTDYTVTLSDNIHAGNAVVTITGKGNYSDKTSVKQTFTIQKMSIVAPKADATSFGYDGDPLTYSLTQAPEYYTISGNTHLWPGDYTVTVTLKDPENTKWSDSDEASRIYRFVIHLLPLEGLVSSTVTKSFTYTGSPITPDPTDVIVKFDSVKFIDPAPKDAPELGINYTIDEIANNVNAGNRAYIAYTVGISYYEEITFIECFTINPKSLDAEDVIISAIEDQAYTGKDIEPALTVTYNDMTLVEGIDYTVSYRDNKDVTDEATAIITAIDGGNYCGSAEKTFKIMLAVARVGAVWYESLQEAIDAASKIGTEQAPGEVKLLTDVELTETLTIDYNKYVTLDLAGHVLSGKNIQTPDKASVIYNEGNLTIIDSNKEVSHKFVPNAGLWVFNEDAEGTLGTDYLEVKGGVITGGTGRNNGGLFIEGGGVFNSANAKLTLQGGTITGNTAGYGGGVYNKGVLLLDGAVICGNTAKQGGGVFNDSTIEASSFTTVKSGSITKNAASEWGGGIYNQMSATLTLLGGAVTDNTITAASGVHYINHGGAGVFQAGQIYVGGTAVVRNNKTDSKNDNLYVGENLINISTINALTTGAELWVNLGKAKGAFTSNGSAADAVFFHTDSSDCSIFFVAEAGTTPAHLELDNLPACKIEGKGEFPSIAKALVGASTDSEAPTKIVLIRDVEENVEIPENVYVELDLCGFVLKGEAVPGENHSVIVNRGHLTITDSTAGQETAPVRYFTDEKCYHDSIVGNTCEGCVKAYKDGSFETYTLTAPEDMTNVITVKGGVITGGATCHSEDWLWADTFGGAVANYGTLNLSGINIVGNHAVFGAVYNDGTLQVTDTLITGNNAYYGGGIYNSDNGNMTVSESKILRNSANCGGGVANFGSGEINDTEMSSNNAVEYGGGIYDYGAGLSVIDSKISFNTAGYGGGISSFGVTIVTGSEIKDNTASSLGGGVDASGMLTFTNCTVSGNTSPCGGGFYVGAYLILDSTTVTENTSPCGGGILNCGYQNLTVGGTTKVKDNTDGEYASNLMTMMPFILGTGEEGNKVSVPASGMEIGVTLIPEGVSTFGAFTTNGTESDTSYFSSDMNYPVAYNETGACLELLDKPEANLSVVMGKDGKVVWTGEEVSDPAITATDDEGATISGMSYEITWYDGEGIDELSPREDAPTEIGLYTVVVTVGPRESYKGCEVVTFRIDPVIKQVDDEAGVTDKTDYVKTEQEDLELHSSAELKDFIRVMVTKPGAEKAEEVPYADGANYAVDKGSIKVTLTKAYLDSLEPGTYVFHIISGINSGTEQNPDWLKDGNENIVEFSADITVEISAGCKEAKSVKLKDGEGQTLLLGGEKAGIYDIKKTGKGYQIYDPEAKQYVSFNSSKKKVELSNTAYDWSYDGNLFASVTETSGSSGWGYFWFWGGRSKSTTTKYYLTLNKGALDITKTATTAMVEEIVSYDKHDLEYEVHTNYHIATCKHCGETVVKKTDHKYDPETHKCVCGKIDPSYGEVTSVTVKETVTTTTNRGWGWGWGWFGWGNSGTKTTTYTYTISTEQVNVTVKKIEYTLTKDGKMTEVKNNKFTASKHLSYVLIDVTDSNGKVTRWFYDGKETTEIVTYSFTVDGETYQAEYKDLACETYGTWESFINSEYNSAGDFKIEENANNKYGMILYKGKYLQDSLGELVHAYDYTGKVSAYLTPCVFEIKKAENDFTTVDEKYYIALQGIEMNAKWEKTGKYTGLILLPLSDDQQTWETFKPTLSMEMEGEKEPIIDLIDSVPYEIKDNQVHVGDDEGYNQNKEVVSRNNLLYQTEARDGDPVASASLMVNGSASNGKVYFYATSPVANLYLVDAGYTIIKAYKPYFNGENWLFVTSDYCLPLVPGLAGFGSVTKATGPMFQENVLRGDVMGSEFETLLRYYQNGKKGEGTVTFRQHDLHSSYDGYYIMEAGGIEKDGTPLEGFGDRKYEGNKILWLDYNTPNGEKSPNQDMVSEYKEWFAALSSIN